MLLIGGENSGLSYHSAAVSRVCSLAVVSIMFINVSPHAKVINLSPWTSETGVFRSS